VNSYSQGPAGQNSRLFGFSYKEDELEQIAKISPVPPNLDDGVTVAAGGLYGYAVDLDQTAGRDFELIRRYRCMAMHPEIDTAIENIINEAIVSDTNDSPVAIDLSNLDVSERIKTIIREEFAYILHLLDFQNKSARPIKYTINKPNKNSSWVSRNMIVTGIMIFLFLLLHFYDFWIPEIETKFINGDWSGLDNETKKFRYYEELTHKFEDAWRTVIYCVSFVFLGLHLSHGFQSAFQSTGFNHNKYTPIIKKAGYLYAIIIPSGFIFIALYHFFRA